MHTIQFGYKYCFAFSWSELSGQLGDLLEWPCALKQEFLMALWASSCSPTIKSSDPWLTSLAPGRPRGLEVMAGGLATLSHVRGLSRGGCSNIFSSSYPVHQGKCFPRGRFLRKQRELFKEHLTGLFSVDRFKKMFWTDHLGIASSLRVCKSCCLTQQLVCKMFGLIWSWFPTDWPSCLLKTNQKIAIQRSSAYHYTNYTETWITSRW